MCLIVFAWDVHPKYKLIVAGNRDEFYERPTSPAAFWPDQPEILAGRDQKAMGTWMGVSKTGKFGALTNFRDPKNIRDDARSRGDIIPQFLATKESPDDFLQTLHQNAETFNGFNFLASDLKTMMHYSNYERKLNVIAPGVHGLSNSLLDTPWPKVEALKKHFSQRIESDFDHEDLLAILANTETFDESILPDTGVSKEWEKALSAICIQTPTYGTCSSSVLTIDRLGGVNFTEKTHPVGDQKHGLVHHSLKITI